MSQNLNDLTQPPPVDLDVASSLNQDTEPGNENLPYITWVSQPRKIHPSVLVWFAF